MFWLGEEAKTKLMEFITKVSEKIRLDRCEIDDEGLYIHGAHRGHHVIVRWDWTTGVIANVEELKKQLCNFSLLVNEENIDVGNEVSEMLVDLIEKL